MELWFLRFLNKSWVIWILETKLASWILGLFLPWLERNDPLPENTGSVRFIFLLSHAAIPKRLTRMSYNTTLLAKHLAEKYPHSTIIGCEFSKNPPHSNEWLKKIDLINPNKLGKVVYWGGLASNTTNERELLIKTVADISTNLKGSIVVGTGGHIRRASMVWQHYHPGENLCFRSTPTRGDDDLENPMTAQRRWQTWVLANLVGIFFYRVLGVEYFAKKNLSQPVG